jgi:hypothetical protein
MSKWLIRWVLFSLVGIGIFWDYPKPQSDVALMVLWSCFVATLQRVDYLTERLRAVAKGEREHVDKRQG